MNFNKLSKKSILLQSLIIPLIVVVFSEEGTEWPSSGDTYVPSPLPTSQINENDTEDTKQDACNNYRCGDYSLAKTIGYEGSRFNWTSIFDDRDSSPFQFIRAGVSCAYNPDRVIFDNDSIKGNNIKNMLWDANIDSVQGGSQNMTNATQSFNVEVPSQVGGDTKDDYQGISISVPKNIHIRMYAIDNHLELRYRSNPCNLILPVYDILPSIRFRNHTYTNSTILRFAWNRNMKKHPSSWNPFFGTSKPNGNYVNASLELWIPNWILERTTLLCPRFDYSLGIEVGGTVNTGFIASKELNSTATNPNSTGAVKEHKHDPYALMSQGPPGRLTVLNSGIGTKVVVAINTTTQNPNFNHETELKFFDQSLNSELQIKTDQNVSGFIQMDGSNMRAAIVQSSLDSATLSAPIVSESLKLRANGFQQVITTKGHSKDVVLGGHSIALYTTDDCSGVQRPGEKTTCIDIDEDFKGISSSITSLNSSQKSEVTMIRGQDFALLNFSSGEDPTPGGLRPLLPIVKLPRSCLVKAEIFDYNCNPLSSGAIRVLSLSRTILGVIVSLIYFLL